MGEAQRESEVDDGRSEEKWVQQGGGNELKAERSHL
jgi:hypothetical protein